MPKGIVVDPGRLVTVTVGQYVQYKRDVATVVSARSGAVTAAELQAYDVGGVAGMALVPGVTAPAHRWELPYLLDVAGGASELSVLNPSRSVPAHVTVALHLPTGTAAPFEEVVAPSSVWTLETSAQLRIPTGVEYSLEVTASGGPGVVVGRIGAGAPQSAAPQWGSQVGISVPVASAPSTTRWLVPSVAPGAVSGKAATPGTVASATSSPAAGVPGDVVVFDNPGTVARRASVRVMTGAGVRVVGTVHVAPHGIATLGARVGSLLVDTNGPLAIEEVGTEIQRNIVPIFPEQVTRLTTIPGISEVVAWVVLSEIGADMSRFPTVGHLISWAGLCPKNDESAGRKRSTRIRAGDPWLRTVLVQAAWAAVRVKGSYFQGQFLRLKSRRGPQKAIIAVAASILTAIYYMLLRRMDFKDLGTSHFDHIDKQRRAKRLLKQLSDLGYEAELKSTA